MIIAYINQLELFNHSLFLLRINLILIEAHKGKVIKLTIRNVAFCLKQ